jgi:hypothetical protein
VVIEREYPLKNFPGQVVSGCAVSKIPETHKIIKTKKNFFTEEL